MALTVDTLRAKRDTLVLAIGSGVTRVQYADRSVDYFSSVAEMERAVEFIDRQIDSLAPSSAKPQTSYASFSRRNA